MRMCCWGSGLTGFADFQGLRAEGMGTYGVTWSSPLPSEPRGAQGECSQVAGVAGVGLEGGRVLFLVLLLWVFLDEVRSWKRAVRYAELWRSRV